LEGDGGLHHPEIISEVQRAAGLDAGQNSHEDKLAANEENWKAGKQKSVQPGGWTPEKFLATTKRLGH
jgi:hypothetical protein